MSVPMSAVQTLDREWLTLRASLIDLAAALDRVERAEGSAQDDPRWDRIQHSLAVLSSPTSNRAEQIQMAFSLSYDSGWRQAAVPR